MRPLPHPPRARTGMEDTYSRLLGSICMCHLLFAEREARSGGEGMGYGVTRCSCSFCSLRDLPEHHVVPFAVRRLRSLAS